MFRPGFSWLAVVGVTVDNEATTVAAAAVYFVTAPVESVADLAVVAVALDVAVVVFVAAVRVLVMPALDFAPAAPVAAEIRPASASPVAHSDSRDMDGFQVSGWDDRIPYSAIWPETCRERSRPVHRQVREENSAGVAAFVTYRVREVSVEWCCHLSWGTGASYEVGNFEEIVLFAETWKKAGDVPP